MSEQKTTLPSQHQNPPGRQEEMNPEPQTDDPLYRGSKKLEDKVAIITGADSGIGQATAIAFAKEGADIVCVYKETHHDAEHTKRKVEEYGRSCILIAGDVGQKEYCKKVVQQTITQFNKIDILINNAAEQHPQENIEDISEDQLERTFRTNIFGYFFMTQAVIPHLTEGSCIVNTTSVTAYRGSGHLIDYAATKGAIVAFTRSLSQNFAQKRIRVNAVAPGPIWTPLIPSTFPAEHVKTFGANEPLGRPGQPSEVAPCYVFLASRDSSYMTGQVLHPNGGEVING